MDTGYDIPSRTVPLAAATKKFRSGQVRTLVGWAYFKPVQNQGRFNDTQKVQTWT